MKFSKLFGVVCVLLLATAACAEEGNDAGNFIFSVSSKGPDRYADGAVVKAGALYAFVWVQTNAVFAGFTADAKLVDGAVNKLLSICPTAEDSHLSSQYLILVRAFAEELDASGTFHLLLVDNRKDDGTVATRDEIAKTGVNGYSEVSARLSAALPTVLSNETVAVVSALPANVPRSKIVGIEVKGDKVLLTVANTVPQVRYNVAAGVDATADANAAAADAAKAGNVSGTITLEVPATRGNFFKVVRDPLTKQGDRP